MAESPRFGKGALVAALVVAGGAGVWFGRCSRHTPADAKAGASAWAPASAASDSASASAAASALARPVATLEKEAPQHFDINENPKWAGGVPLREMDRDIFKLLNDLEHLDRTQMPDVFPNRSYKVKFVGSVATQYVSHVLIDMNRDGKVDERWELKQLEVTRTVLHDPNAGDEAVRYTLSQGKWQVH